MRVAFALLYWLEFNAQRVGRPGNRYVMNPQWMREHIADDAKAMAAAAGLA